MRKSLIVLPLLFAAAACGQNPDQMSKSERSAEMASDAAVGSTATESTAADSARSAPDIDTSAAPGVAFDFRYVFALDGARIGGVQEEHAQACKKLGIAKCRITGMDYQAAGDGDVSAMMAFKVDPAIATDFTRDAKNIVEKADGKLDHANLKGTDLGSTIAVTDATVAQVKEELNVIQKQLELPSLSKDVRSQLVQRSAELREQLRQLSQSRNSDRTALAMTPVVFEYQTMHSFPGFDGRSPIAGAAAASANSFITMLQFIMVAVGVVAPWALFGGALFWLVRRFRKKSVAADVA